MCLLSALWLVDDSAAVSLRCVLTRDRMTNFFVFQLVPAVVLPAVFEVQNAVEWRMVMSRGQDERSQMHAMSLLLNTCSGMTNRVLIDDGARWILQGDEQERENRTAGVKALFCVLAATTSGRAKELVKQGLSNWSGMIALGRIRERFGKTAGMAKLSDVFQFQWTSPDSLEDKWLRWQKLMRQVDHDLVGRRCS